MEPEIRQLPCTLTPEEIDTKGRLLARKIAERDAFDDERKAAAKLAGERVKGMDEEIAKLAEAVNTGKERRPIPVSQRHDPRRFCVETIRHDTMAVIETRAMSSDEVTKAQQPNLFDERATADSRDDGPTGEPENVHAPAPVIPGPFAQGGAPTGEPGCTCGSTTPGVHEDGCAAMMACNCGQTEGHAPSCPRVKVCASCGIVAGHRPDCPRDQIAADAEVTDPNSLLSGKPDGNA